MGFQPSGNLLRKMDNIDNAMYKSDWTSTNWINTWSGDITCQLRRKCILTVVCDLPHLRRWFGSGGGGCAQIIDHVWVWKEKSSLPLSKDHNDISNNSEAPGTSLSPSWLQQLVNIHRMCSYCSPSLRYIKLGIQVRATQGDTLKRNHRELFKGRWEDS